MTVFDERFISVIDQVDNWEEAVRLSGNLLLLDGKIEPGYIDAMIENIQKLGPYIIIAPKVALPHARPESGVKEKGISVLVLKEPTYFGQNEVKLLICLAAVDSSSHLHLLQTIAEWLQDENTLNRIMEAQSVEELHEVLSKFYI
ncbi:hypothetical protein GCM10008967_04230 [Bacillus carboniphilus]|uniref:Ascorbate-specific PTS system EIIA component n=1 Tax=Bacillus carboniphilus TaxID=86663 RepID=A0ABN0VTE3_9BACI